MPTGAASLASCYFNALLVITKERGEQKSFGWLPADLAFLFLDHEPPPIGGAGYLSLRLAADAFDEIILLPTLDSDRTA